MKNISTTCLLTAWTQDEKENLDKTIEFVENYQGSNFILDATSYLYEILKFDYILITVIDPLPEPTVNSIICLKNGVLVPNLHYPLAGTPCEGVFNKEQNYYPNGVMDIFPHNQLLNQMQVQSYMGIPLFDKQENGLGCLALLHHNIIDCGGFVEALINVLLPRLEEELSQTCHSLKTRSRYLKTVSALLV